MQCRCLLVPGVVCRPPNCTGTGNTGCASARLCLQLLVVLRPPLVQRAVLAAAHALPSNSPAPEACSLPRHPIASCAASAQQGTAASVLDTRKTVPGLRLLDKWAVSIGSGMNHRIGGWRCWGGKGPMLFNHRSHAGPPPLPPCAGKPCDWSRPSRRGPSHSARYPRWCCIAAPLYCIPYRCSRLLYLQACTTW